jgi:hypothetical protein
MKNVLILALALVFIGICGSVANAQLAAPTATDPVPTPSPTPIVVPVVESPPIPTLRACSCTCRDDTGEFVLIPSKQLICEQDLECFNTVTNAGLCLDACSSEYSKPQNNIRAIGGSCPELF